MTPNETSPDQAVVAVAVTQADYDAAILICWITGWNGVAKLLKQGWSPLPGTRERQLLEEIARHRLSAIPTPPPADHTDLIAALQAVNMRAVSIDPETFEHGFHVDWSAIKLVMAALANAESPRELPDLAGHTADAVRDAVRIVIGQIVSFDDSARIAEHIIAHIAGLRTALELG